ncbi:MAG: VWA domain-containing protein [Herpetosiphonaceae bacterium]|nr:VWA domain-containing protein [Herpetosiphonaceae bacterium]
MANDMTLTINWARSPLPANTAQVGYLLIEARPAMVAAAHPTAINFCMVLDRSGSMDGAKMDNLKKAVQTVIETLSPQDTVAVVVFDETAETIVPATLADNKVALSNRVEAIRVQGGTAMSTGLEAGLEEIRKHLAPDRPSTLLLLTDGQTWGDEDRCRELANELAQASVRVTALGLGDEWNEKLLDDLAAATKGTSDYIADPSKIGSYFQAATTAAQSTSVRNARLTLRLAKGVQPRAVYRVTPLIANLGYKPISDREMNVDMGDIQSNVGGSVLAEVMLPAQGAGQYRVAQAELVYDVPQAQQVDERVRMDAMLEFTADAAASKADPRIMNLVERVTAFKLQTRALDEAAAGNMVGATQKLRSAATRLLDMGELELAETMNRAADTMTSGSGPSAADQKQITYATRRLTLSELTGGDKADATNKS